MNDAFDVQLDATVAYKILAKCDNFRSCYENFSRGRQDVSKKKPPS